jgi:hypothetical protein
LRYDVVRKDRYHLPPELHRQRDNHTQSTCQFCPFQGGLPADSKLGDVDKRLDGPGVGKQSHIVINAPLPGSVMSTWSRVQTCYHLFFSLGQSRPNSGNKCYVRLWVRVCTLPCIGTLVPEHHRVAYSCGGLGCLAIGHEGHVSTIRLWGLLIHEAAAPHFSSMLWLALCYAIPTMHVSCWQHSSYDIAGQRAVEIEWPCVGARTAIKNWPTYILCSTLVSCKLQSLCHATRCWHCNPGSGVQSLTATSPLLNSGGGTVIPMSVAYWPATGYHDQLGIINPFIRYIKFIPTRVHRPSSTYN